MELRVRGGRDGVPFLYDLGVGRFGLDEGDGGLGEVGERGSGTALSAGSRRTDDLELCDEPERLEVALARGEVEHPRALDYRPARVVNTEERLRLGRGGVDADGEVAEGGVNEVRDGVVAGGEGVADYGEGGRELEEEGVEREGFGVDFDGFFGGSGGEERGVAVECEGGLRVGEFGQSRSG